MARSWAPTSWAGMRPRSSMSWRWHGRMSTRWKRSSWRFTHTRRCPRPWLKRRSIPWVEWWTCERPARDRPRRAGVRRRARRGNHRGRAGHRTHAGASRQRIALPGERGRPGPRGHARRPRGRRDVRLAPQPLARQPVAAGRDRRPGVRRHPAARLHRLADRPSARRRRSRGVGCRLLPGGRRGERVGRPREPRRCVEGRGVTDRTIDVIEAGLVPYREALEWQRSLAEARIEGRLGRDVILLLQHPPVVTLGRNARAGHVREARDLPVFEVERGGDVTFHGPGQLVGYPILDLGGYRRDLHWYLRTLEQALIDALAELDIPAERKPGYTGVWTRGGDRKIASIGVHVKQWVTWHGFALNVTTDLSHFDRIVPCGNAGVVMTSIQRETGKEKGETNLWEETVAAVIRGFEGAFGVTSREWSCSRSETC